MSRLDLSEGPARMAEYEELYPDGWAGDEEAERRHRQAVSKIVSWPRDDENTVGYEYMLAQKVMTSFARHKFDKQKLNIEVKKHGKG